MTSILTLIFTTTFSSKNGRDSITSVLTIDDNFDLRPMTDIGVERTAQKTFFMYRDFTVLLRLFFFYKGTDISQVLNIIIIAIGIAINCVGSLSCVCECVQ